MDIPVAGDIPRSSETIASVLNRVIREDGHGFTSRRSGRGSTQALLNNLLPRNRAFGYVRVVALIGVAPIPNGWRGCTGIGRVIVAVIIATIVGGGR